MCEIKMLYIFFLNNILLNKGLQTSNLSTFITLGKQGTPEGLVWPTFFAPLLKRVVVFVIL